MHSTGFVASTRRPELSRKFEIRRLLLLRLLFSIATNMPHSIPETPSSPPQLAMAADTIADVATSNESVQAIEQDTATESQTLSNESQEGNTAEADITMAEVEANLPIHTAVSVKVETKHDVRLEDLFADLDSDEEFPSSKPQDNKLSSSPPPTSSFV